MAKNLVICCDGTNNKFGSDNTNVVRLFQVLAKDQRQQLAYYDPGVGTLPDVGAWSKLSQWVSQGMGLAFGAGITRNIEEAYKFLMDWYEPGDRIFLFGFSRGSYTVRALAGVVHQFGLLPSGMDNLIPYILRLSKEINELDDTNKEGQQKYWSICKEFRATFARAVGDGAADSQRVRIHFLGLWDTVSSVGWIFDPKRFPYVSTNPSVDIVRHAIAIDERRWFFRQNTWKPSKGQDVLEVWFPGDHCDIGGGHSGADNGLAKTAFYWMLRQAEKAGITLDSHHLSSLEEDEQCPWWMQPKHDLLPTWWVLAQPFPKRPNRKGWPRWGLKLQGSWPFLVPKGRTIPNGVWLHKSLVQRVQHGSLHYRPPNLKSTFLESISAIKNVPEMIRYDGPDSENPTHSTQI